MARIYMSKDSNRNAAQKFDVDENTIGYIRNNKRWKNITKGLCFNGVRDGKGKLNINNVKTIYLSKKSCRYLSKRFGVHYMTIWNIKNDRKWKRITKNLKH